MKYCLFVIASIAKQIRMIVWFLRVSRARALSKFAFSTTIFFSETVS